MRSAFAIGDGYVLTAWHCVSAIVDGESTLWLRLQSPSEDDDFIDVPVKYHDRSPKFDAALLTFDDECAGDNDRDLCKALDSVALPLGVDVAVHDDVRILGFPERNVAAFATAHRGKVKTTTSKIGGAWAICLQIDAFGARYPEGPKGMSGGPLARVYPDGSERVVGIVSAFPPAGPENRDALGGAVVCRRIADLRQEFPAVAEALRRAAPTKNGTRPGHEVELSSDVVEASRPVFESAGVVPPDRFSRTELHAVRPRTTSRLANLIKALDWAVAAKPVLLDIGATELEIGQLQVIYRREVGGWPRSGSRDALLVEAADVALSESRRGWPGGLGALARFVIGTAATLSASPRDHPVLEQWIETLGHQTADARGYYLDRRHAPAWLLIDLGDEPAPGASPWPDRVGWTHFVHKGRSMGQVTQEVTTAPTEAGLLEALRAILRNIPPAWPLWVDIAMPYELLGRGIEHWPVFRVDEEWESLSERCHPRLRWSQRRRDLALHGRCAERTARSSWETVPDPLLNDLLRDTARLKKWVRTAAGHAWLVGGHPPAAGADPLRVLLREGCGFLIWFTAGEDDRRRRRIAETVSGIPVPARRMVIPDELPTLDLDPAIIWDDPCGRGEFTLPPLVPAEHIQTHQP